MSLASVVSNTGKPHHALFLLQSSATQSCLPILRDVIKASKIRTLLFCFLFPPACLLNGLDAPASTTVFDRTGDIPHYNESRIEPREYISENVRSSDVGPLSVVIDSVDTLASDLGSVSLTYLFIRDLLSILRSKPSPSRLILHITSPSDILHLLTQTHLSPSFAHAHAHPPELLAYLATAYATMPPPASPEAQFWNVFTSFTTREYETDRLVFGPSGEGSGGAGTGEIVIELIVRSPGDGGGRRVARNLEGWSPNTGPCDLRDLVTLKNIWSARAVEETRPDPTKNVSFDLSLSQAQQKARASVPLPYIQQGKQFEKQVKAASEIFYDPDSADDIDDDDPDDDLDI